jgi:predicted amidophosphoribosyltransferase
VPERHRAAVRGKRIVLVDDVHTSGATTAACTAALLRAGAASVTILCWARVLDGEAD